MKWRNEHKYIDKTLLPFNIEHELGKIKIIVPLVQLAMNPIYQRKIEKVMLTTHLYSTSAKYREIVAYFLLNKHIFLEPRLSE